jgi:hypothetical protein
MITDIHILEYFDNLVPKMESIALRHFYMYVLSYTPIQTDTERGVAPAKYPFKI